MDSLPVFIFIIGFVLIIFFVEEIKAFRNYKKVYFRLRSEGIEVGWEDGYGFLPFDKITWAGKYPRRKTIFYIREHFQIKDLITVYSKSIAVFSPVWLFIFESVEGRKGILFAPPENFRERMAEDLELRGLSHIR